MEYIYSILGYNNSVTEPTSTFGKPAAYKNINTSSIVKKCGNR